jgi:hypothetical protein
MFAVLWICDIILPLQYHGTQIFYVQCNFMWTVSHNAFIHNKSLHLSVNGDFRNINKWWHVNIKCILNFFILNSLLTYRIQNQTKLPIMLSICNSWGKLRSGQILPKCETLLVIYWFPKARLQNTTTWNHLEVRKYHLLFKFLM